MGDLPTPYLLFLGDAPDGVSIKTALGVKQWAPERVVGEWSLPGCGASTGLDALTPEQAVGRGARGMLIGVAPAGGRLPDHWIPALEQALMAGLDLVAGLHDRMADHPMLAAAAAARGRRLVDVRRPEWKPLVGTGERRSGRRLLTVGTDCALGKKYTALSIAAELQRRGVAADFRATGQTGILIAGRGIAIDAVVADFIAGAAEVLSPSAPADHWDIIEGQGSLFHPSYAGVSLGLLHGSQPDAIVLCHDPMREHIHACPGFLLPPLEEAIELNERLARLTNREARCVGVSLNTSQLTEREALKLIDATGQRLGLPCIDPVRIGPAAIVDRLQELWP